MQKLFTKFFQAQDITIRKTKGSGLGLAISKGIIEQHGGKIWAKSEGEGKGSTFSFTLPLGKGHIPKTEEKEKSKYILIGERMLLSEQAKSIAEIRTVKPKKTAKEEFVGTGDATLLSKSSGSDTKKIKKAKISSKNTEKTKR